MGGFTLVAMEAKLSIGRFSKMTRLSVKALRHYDDIGVLSPAEIDPSTGYRYYVASQARDAETIRLLRSLEVPLDEIADVLRSRSDPELVAKILDRHRTRLAEVVEVQQRRLLRIESLISSEEPIMNYDVTTKTVPDTLVAGLRITTDQGSIGAHMARGFPALVQAVVEAGGAPGGMPFSLYHDVIDEESAGDIELVVPLVGDLERELPEPMTTRVLPGGTVATTVHRGPYAEVAPAYHVLTGWLQEHGREPSGSPREIYLNDPTDVPESEYLTEVQYPCTPS